MFNWIFKKKEKIEENSLKEVSKELVVLIIMDGLGISPEFKGNAVVQAKTPFLDQAWTNGRSTLIHASGTHVGLPAEEAGNSEVGHLNIGSGQVVYQSLPRINDAIASGSFKNNETIHEAFNKTKERGTKLHLMGILSAGGVHGHVEHMFVLLDICKAAGVEPYLHLFLDGRDTAPTDGYFYLSKTAEKLKEIGMGKIASVSGRFFAMDRDKRWDRTQKAYNAMVGIGERTSKDIFALIQKAYKEGENDERFTPTTMLNEDNTPIGQIQSGDSMIFFNFREDRARQITRIFVDEEFDSLKRKNFPGNLHFVTMTGYESDLLTHIIFPPKPIPESLSSVISKYRLNQFHISETEKFMHITYFLNCGTDIPHPGETFFNIPSPKVFDYAQAPHMSAEIVKDEVLYRLEHLDKKKYSFIVINFANPDMIGHTGDMDVAIEAVEFTDKCVKAVVQKVVEVGGAAVLIADHGNCEVMIDPVTKKPNTAHTNNPVPFIVVDDFKQISMESGKGKMYKIGTGDNAHVTGILADVAPTILSMLDIEQPPSMTGIDLLSVV